MRRFWEDETGQDLVEYALIVAAVGLALITTIHALTESIASVYTSIAWRLDGVEWQQAKQ